MKKWTLKPVQKIPKELEKLRLNPITVQLLLGRNIAGRSEIEKFFLSRYEDLHSPFGLSGMKKAVERLKNAIDKKENVVIFGDYDADGVTSSTLIKEVLEKFGLKPAVYIPDRNKEGYGLNEKAIDFIKEKYNVDLIITVDCGISNWKEAAYAQKKGIEIILTDHHSIPKKLPSDCILINPKLPGQEYPFRDLAGVGVAFKLAQALFEELDPTNIAQLKWYLDLVAIGTIADCVPLVGENRIFAKFGLIVLQKTKRVGLQEIIQTARLNIGEKNPPTAENVAFQIGPRLNASGRMDHADVALNLLLEKERVNARVLALEVESKNSERQKATLQVYKEVKDSLDENKKYRLIARKSQHWPLGIVGVVAGRICDEFHCPVFLFRENEALLEGSGRSIAAFDIVSAVGKIDRHVEKYGGHAQAMGIKLHPKKFKLFEKELLEVIESDYDDEKWGKKLLIDAEIPSDKIDWDVYSEIKKFEPFGEGNCEPIFVTHDLAIREAKVVGNGQKHLKIFFEAGRSKLIEGIFWKKGEMHSEFQPGKKFSVVFHLRSNQWNGNQKLELNIIDLKAE